MSGMFVYDSPYSEFLEQLCLGERKSNRPNEMFEAQAIDEDNMDVEATIIDKDDFDKIESMTAKAVETSQRTPDKILEEFSDKE